MLPNVICLTAFAFRPPRLFTTGVCASCWYCENDQSLGLVEEESGLEPLSRRSGLRRWWESMPNAAPERPSAAVAQPKSGRWRRKAILCESGQIVVSRRGALVFLNTVYTLNRLSASVVRTMTYMSVNDSNAGAEARVRLGRSDWSSSFFFLPTAPVFVRKGHHENKYVHYPSAHHISIYIDFLISLTSKHVPSYQSERSAF
jgi:hypothetical protein